MLLDGFMPRAPWQYPPPPVSPGWQLLQNHPYLYSVYLSPPLRGRYPVLERVMAGQRPPPGTNNRVTQLATHTGNTFTSFAKYTTFNGGRLLVRDMFVR